MTASAGLEIHIRDDEAEAAAPAHQQPPGALRVVMVGLGVVGGGHAATGRGQVTSTTCEIGNMKNGFFISTPSDQFKRSMLKYESWMNDLFVSLQILIPEENVVTSAAIEKH